MMVLMGECRIEFCHLNFSWEQYSADSEILRHLLYTDCSKSLFSCSFAFIKDDALPSANSVSWKTRCVANSGLCSDYGCANTAQKRSNICQGTPW